MSPARLERLVADIFAAAGMGGEDAALVAAVLVWADRRGMGSHGVMRVPRYLELMRAGDMNARPQMKVSKETPASVLLDADRASGPVAMTRAMQLAIGKAKEMGVGLCLVRATTHTAALGYYTHLAADAGMAAIAISGSWANMAYHGARAAGVSTAPLAIAVPGEGGTIALDMASAIVSNGKLMQAKRSGERLQPGLALDKDGNATTDPRAAAIPLPLGGAKGSGLSLLIECLTSLLAGNPLLAESLEGTPLGKHHRQNAMVIAIDIARFIEPAEFRREAGRLARAIKALPPQEGMDILLPGERGDRAAAAQRDEIRLSSAIIEELKTAAASVGVTA
jgi:LDH2 family malate/lactate/ureidoglycolate dehydrogenase